MNSNSSLFRGKLLITLTALFTAALLTTSCGYSISDSAMEEGLVPDAVSQFYDNENKIIFTTAGPLLFQLKITVSMITAALTTAAHSALWSATLWDRKYRVAVR